jgi:hypothetical protein
MLKGKQKLSKEELAAQRENRMNNVADKLNLQIAQMTKKQDTLLAKLLDARKMGLKPQEDQARALLARCLSGKKRAEGMLMTLELARESRDLAELNYQFLDCIGELSDELSSSVKKTNAKKTEKKYTKALYKASEQTRQLDEMLDAGNYDATASMDFGSLSEFDDEIDGLVNFAESRQTAGGTVRKDRQ